MLFIVGYFFRLGSPHLVQVPDEEKLVDSNFDRVHRNGPRKSVSIVLPSDEKG